MALTKLSLTEQSFPGLRIALEFDPGKGVEKRPDYAELIFLEDEFERTWPFLFGRRGDGGVALSGTQFREVFERSAGTLEGDGRSS